MVRCWRAHFDEFSTAMKQHFATHSAQLLSKAIEEDNIATAEAKDICPKGGTSVWRIC